GDRHLELRFARTHPGGRRRVARPGPDGWPAALARLGGWRRRGPRPAGPAALRPAGDERTGSPSARRLPRSRRGALRGALPAADGRRPELLPALVTSLA